MTEKQNVDKFSTVRLSSDLIWFYQTLDRTQRRVRSRHIRAIFILALSHQTHNFHTLDLDKANLADWSVLIRFGAPLVRQKL